MHDDCANVAVHDEAGFLATVFTEARTHNSWSDREVDEADLRRAYALAAFGPTSANCQPLRVVFVRAGAAKDRLLAAVAPGNLDKVKTAPVTAIIAYDLAFYEHLPRLFPHRDVRASFIGRDEHIQSTAFRNATLQAGYFILALRAVGLDCGPLSGFDAGTVDQAFFPDGRFRTNFLCNIGYGDAQALFGRLPRLDFDESCQIV